MQRFALLSALLLVGTGCSVATGNGEPSPSPTEAAPTYACGWPMNDPGNLESTGNQVGDIIRNFSAPDQCEEEYKIWDGYGSYTVAFMMAFW